MPDALEFLSHEEILSNPRMPRPIAVEGIIRVGDLALITGSYDTFKSTLALELAWSLATGRPWLRAYPVVNRIRMGVLQTEIDPGAYDERVTRYPQAADLFLCTAPDFTLDRLPELREVLDDADLDGIVIDPLGQVWPAWARNGEPFSENAKNHVSPLMREVKELQRTVVLVHHDPKPSQGYTGRASGSAALLNDPDVRIFVDAYGKRDDNRIHVSVRNRLQRRADPFIATFDEDSMRLAVTKGEQLPSKVVPRSQPPYKRSATRIAAQARRDHT